MNTLAPEIQTAIAGHVAVGGAAAILALIRAVEPRFELIDDDQVLDRHTGLIWTRRNVAGGRMTWAKAIRACGKLDIGGSSDWRLPTRSDLLTLVDLERADPAIDTEYFPDCKSDWYWSNTPYARSPGDCAWVVSFGLGDAYWDLHGYDGFVRAVRPGQ